MDSKVTRREFVKASAAAVVLPGILRNTESAAADDSSRPNILLIMTDQQPGNTIRAYGNKQVQTPHMDSIAEKGVQFTRCYLAGFACAPSRASILTGLYPHNHGVFVNDLPLDENVTSIGDILKERGYDTAYIGKWHLGGSMYRGIKGRGEYDNSWQYKAIPDPERGMRFEKQPGGGGEDEPQHGFTKWIGGWKHYKAYLREVGLGELVDKNPSLGNHNDLPSGPEGQHIYSKLPQEHHMAAFFAGEAVDFIQNHDPSADPFCLVLSFYGPHLPVAPPKPWDTMYPPEEIPLPDNLEDHLENKPLSQRQNTRCYKLGDWSKDQYRDYISRYWGYVSYIDQQIGRVLSALEERNLTKDTIIIFTSDHGDMVGGHGMIFKLRCSYEELMRVPLLIRYDGRLQQGTICDELIDMTDLVPTLMEMMEMPAPEGMDGSSFLPLLQGKSIPWRDAVFCEQRGTIMVCTGRWKYCLNWSPRDLDELYDLESDPGELTNLAVKDEYENIVMDMRERMTQWLKDTGHPFGDIINKAMKERAMFFDLWPEITSFSHPGGSKFRIEFAWRVQDEAPDDYKYWTFIHFMSPGNREIAFRGTRWPDPPTTEWNEGETYSIAPFDITVPPDARAGKYQIRIGLWNPDHKSGPRLVRGQGNYVIVGALAVNRTEEGISSISIK